MAQQGIMRSYMIIIEKLMAPFHPDFNQLISTLENEGFSISKRTLQRYIEAIRIDFDINIIYNRSTNTYIIDEEDKDTAERFLYFMGMQHTSEVLGNQLNKRSLKFISSDINLSFKGIEWIEHILKAMQQGKWIIIKYRKFAETTSKEYKLQPYLLKEYQGRWYLFSRLGDGEDFRTFGLDRIVDVRIQNQKFNRDKTIDPQAYFNNIIGLVYDNHNKVQEIQIRVVKPQAEYLKTLPIHHSQQILKEDKDAIIFTYKLIPNFELTQKILTHAHFVEVLKPKHLRDEIKSIAQTMVKNNS
jgi:predicted DNA-binding transcriptional regulator YafY